jgi:hypothetical protein
MRAFTVVVSLLSLLAFAGCKKKEEPAKTEPAKTETPPAEPTKTDTPPTEPTKTEPAASGGGSGKMEQKMANCPSAVKGATTTVAETAEAVEVTVVGADDAATKEIRARATKLVEAAKAPDAEVKHDSKGTGGGGIGFCPVVLADTTVTSAEVDKGVKLTVKPNKPENLKPLIEESKRRNENMPKDGGGGGGGGGSGGGGGEPGPGGPGSGTGGGKSG